MCEVANCKGCDQPFPLMSYPMLIKKGKLRRTPYCAVCKRARDKADRERRIERESGAVNLPFSGLRMVCIDAPFPDRPSVFTGWRGPVEPLPWRVAL